MSDVPQNRIRAAGQKPVAANGKFVLYWMTAARRRHSNYALQRAVHWAVELRKPLRIVEGLQKDYPLASARFSNAILEGMIDNQAAFRDSAATYEPYIEDAFSPRGRIHALAADACVVVTDDYPAFDHPRWIRSVAARSPVLVEAVDSNGLLPMRLTDRVFLTARSFRRFVQENIHLQETPAPDALRGVDLPRLRLPRSTLPQPLGTPYFQGGNTAAHQVLRRFLDHGLALYDDQRNQPESNATSGLSAHLHFGHISAHEIYNAVVQRKVNAEAFIDQLTTWREIGFNMCVNGTNPFHYDSLPAWARKTLAEHSGDRREYLYSLSQFEGAETHDGLWNAAQRQLVREGRIHNYLRMLWGKKILEWSRSPEEALETMVLLNNKYAFDGRDPNSYTGIFWVLGRYDRPWAPVRPVFGMIRYMSSANTARKLRVREYIARYAVI